MKIDYINTADVLKTLAQEDDAAPHVTIYLPTHKSAAPPHMSEDQIRLKNLVHQAADLLKKNTDNDYQKLAKTLCAWHDEAMQDKRFWESQTEGLLLCAKPGSMQLFHLPLDTEEYVSVDSFYHLAPVLGLLQDAKEFYVLALAQQQPMLFRGDMYGLHDSGIKLPKSLIDGLNIDEMNQKSEQGRAADGANGDVARFNGRGGAKNPAEEERMRFFRMIDHAIYEKADRKLPLILAGIDSELVEYRSISSYPNIVKTSIHGSFGGGKPHDLYEQVRPIFMHNLIDRQHRDAFERFERIRGENPQLTATDDLTASEAAGEGRVDTLFIDMSRFTTDSVRDNMQPTRVLSFPRGEVTKLLQTVARNVWLQGGRIINLDPERFPLNTHMSAICRY
jgi:hypothetical protein